MGTFTLVQFVVGILGLIVGARMLVQGAAKLAVSIGISPLVVGLTVVAFGTSSPELAVTGFAAYQGRPELALGNVVGSNIANLLLVVGCSALITPLVVRLRIVRWDVPLMIAVSVLLLVLAWDGALDRRDGMILVGGIVLYTVISIAASRWATARERSEASVELAAEIPSSPVHGTGPIVLQIVLIVAGLGLLVFGANWLVEAAVTIAKAFGVSELVIGLTVVAVGTSLPEAATSIIAGLRGERDLAIGNAVGSNVFNILAVLGVAGLVAREGVPVSPGALGFDIPVMIAVAVACLPITFTGGRIARWEGLLFLCYYAAYLAYLFLSATHHDQFELFNIVMLAFVVPLTVLGLILSVVLAVRRGQTPERVGSPQ